MDENEMAAREWEDFAREKDRWADYLESRGEHAGAARTSAQQARETAAEIRAKGRAK